MREIGDFGPIYTETNLASFPVEPWNTYSNILFLLIIVYFSFITKLNYKKFPLITVSLPILGIGFIGGTTFHALRSNSIWLIMDFVPIILLCLISAVYYWSKITKSKIYGLIITLLFFAIFFLIRSELEISRNYKIALGYSFNALCLLMPIFIYSFKNNCKNVKYILLAILSFLTALFFRQFDNNSFVLNNIPMGTHFLWHIFGAVSVYLLLKHSYLNDKDALIS
jgi:hemolysin III